MKIKHIQEVRSFLRAGDYEETSEGLLIHGGLLARGMYVHSINGGQDERRDANLIVDEGILYLLNVGLGNGTQHAAWYLAPFGNVYTPTAGLTAATFNATAGELAGSPEGYTEVLRETWVFSAAAVGKISNLAARAEFTMVTASTIDVNGAGLLSDSGKNGTLGTLVSASKFAAVRTLNNGDTFELGYEVELTDT